MLNRLVATTEPGVSGYLHYDPLGRLAQLTGSPISDRTFLYDGIESVAEYSSGGAMQRRTVFGPGIDEPLVQYEPGGARRFLHADERGSIVAASDSAGNLAAGNRYDEYGVPAAANSGRFQYTGQLWLHEIGVQYSKARMYAPHLGRFPQTDPIGYLGGMNMYAYVGNDPVNFTDPLGLDGEGGEIVVTHRCGNGTVRVNGVCRSIGSSGGGGGGSTGGGGGGGANGGEIVVIGRRPQPQPAPDEIIITAERPRKLSTCVINFLASQGYGAKNLADIRFIRTMQANRLTRLAERRGHGAITLGNNIYVSPNSWREVANPLAGPVFFEEVIHSVQWHVSGSANFGLSYTLGAPFGHDNHIEAQAIGISRRLYEAYLAPGTERC